MTRHSSYCQSADNIFVFHETWASSRRLRYRGQPASDSQRISWTIEQAAVPLFFANATTARFAVRQLPLQYRLDPPIWAMWRDLIFVNFLLALCATPAILLSGTTR